MLALYRDKLKWNEAYPHKLITAWRCILLTLFISYVSWLLANIMIESSCCFQKCNRNWGHRCLYNGLSESLGGLLQPHLCPPSGADEVGSHGSLSLLFMMKMMVWNFMSNTHKAMTAHIVIFKHCGVFSAISRIWTMNSTISEIWTIILGTKCLLLWSTILLSTKTPSDPYWICGSHLNFEYVLG
jgi:hypothetical protein